MFDLPIAALVVGAALIGAINPTSIGVLVMVLSSALGSGKSTKRFVLLGSVFILTLLISYIALGLGAEVALHALPPLAGQYVSMAIGVIAVAAGLVEVKDYFWYGKGFSLQIPRYFANKIHEYSPRKSSVVGMKMLGLLVAVAELPCIGVSYLCILAILRTSTTSVSFSLLGIYNLVFALPLIIILLVVARGSKISTITKWKEESKGTMRLFMGLVLITLGWILLLIANGTINFG